MAVNVCKIDTADIDTIDIDTTNDTENKGIEIFTVNLGKSTITSI